MITETILNRFRKNIISEELHLPHGTKSAKLVCHVDLDGVTSGISMVHQLVKQGIPKERITIEFAQYGDEKKDKNFDDRFNGKKGQYIGVTDFAKLPKAKPFDTINKLCGFKANANELKSFISSKDFSKINYKEFEKEVREKFNVIDNKFTEASMKAFYKELKAFSLLKNKPELNNIKELEYPLVTPDFVSDHHSNEDGSLSGGKQGEIGVKSPSENEIMANKYAPGFWSKSDIDAISMVDSANYSEDELKNTIFLQKHFSGANKKRNLAILTSVIYDNMVKKDKRAAKYVILNAGPNLVSLYTTTLKAAELSKDSVKAFNLLKDGNTKEASEMMKRMPKIFTKNWTDNDTYKDVKPIMGLDDWRNKNNKDVENAKTGYKTKIDEKKLEEIKGKRDAESKQIRDDIKSKKGKLASSNNFTLFNGKDKKTQYSRFMPALFTVNGQRQPFSIRYWDNFFQVAKSPFYKGDVDFSIVGDKVIADVGNFLKSKGFSDFKINQITDNMKKENGGHKNGIWSFVGFDKIKESSKEIGGDEYWDNINKVERAKKVKLTLPKAEQFIKDKQPVIDNYKKIRQDTMELAIKSVIKWVNKLYPPSQENLDKLKTEDKTFEGK